ncbi:MAG: hypothetical protein MRZ74_03265 [Blautia sp.]|nr:hypothetical protein [Blautia sp.]
MKKRRTGPVSNIGGVSLLMTFIVLCLTVFAVLSLSDAVSEAHYVQKLAGAQDAAARASEEATRRLQEICMLLETDPGRLLQEKGLTVDCEGPGPVIAWDTPVDDSTMLHIELTLPEGTSLSSGRPVSGTPRITAWKKVPSADWTADHSVTLLQP